MFPSPRIVRTVAHIMREIMINVSQTELLAKEFLKNSQDQRKEHFSPWAREKWFRLDNIEPKIWCNSKEMLKAMVTFTSAMFS